MAGWGTVMSSRRTLLYVLTLSILGSTTAYAFWSRTIGDYKVHQAITSTALAAPVYTFDTPNTAYHFSGNAIHIINESHAKADSDPYDERDHFDNESFAKSFTSLAVRRSELMTDLASSNPDMFGTDWPLLGYMLHQIQDFYSHSTWAKTHPTSGAGAPIIADFGAATELAAIANSMNGLPAFLQNLPTPGAVCTSTPPDPGSSLLLAMPPLTTGYFSPGVFGSGVFVQPNPPAGRCAHGVLAYAATGCAFKGVGGDTGWPDGIAHDEPCFKLEEDLKIYDDAYAMAELETHTFVQAIINDLLASGNRYGICLLLGINLTEKPCLNPMNLFAGTYQGSLNLVGKKGLPVTSETFKFVIDSFGNVNVDTTHFSWSYETYQSWEVPPGLIVVCPAGGNSPYACPAEPYNGQRVSITLVPPDMTAFCELEIQMNSTSGHVTATALQFGVQAYTQCGLSGNSAAWNLGADTPIAWIAP
jgi:hypothetical protein